MAKPTTTKPKTSRSTTKSEPGRRSAGALGLLLAGLLLIAGGVDNVAVTVLHVQLIAPGAFAVQVVFVLVGLAVLLRGLDGLWGPELRSAGGQLMMRWRRWRSARPPTHVAGVFSGVPPDRNLLFLDRNMELEQLRGRLIQERRVDLSGLGGVGKSQLAREYLYRHRDDYPDGVFWLRGEKAATLSGDLAALAWLPDLQLEERNLREQERVIEAVIGWLRAHRRWLLVIDSLDEAALPILNQLLVPGLMGHVLVTSRVARWDRDPLAVRPMLPEAAIALLLERSGQEDEAAAATVAQMLGGLPLALVQAAGYLKASGRELSGYAELLRTRLAQLMREGKPADYPLTVAATWTVSIERIEREQPAAAALLRLCAFLAPDDIPVSLVLEAGGELPKELKSATDDEVRLDRAIGELRRYAMADRQGDSMSVHRLVQAVVQDSLGRDMRERWHGAAVRLLRAAYPSQVDDPRVWPVCARLLPHVQLVMAPIGEQRVERRASSWLLDRIATYLQHRGEFGSARPLFERALAMDETDLGPDHPGTATSLNNLALLLKDQGELAAARPLFGRSLEITERVLGPDHPNTASSLNNLALLLQEQGELAAARPLFERSLEITERVLGPDHPDTAGSLNNLASLLKDQGELAVARPLFERALEITERVLGPDHPDTARSLNNLALLLQEQGELAAARPLYERALEIHERVLGPDHPDTATSLNNLAGLLQEQGELAAARLLFERALEIRERVLGPDHPATAVTRSCLTQILP